MYLRNSAGGVPVCGDVVCGGGDILHQQAHREQVQEGETVGATEEGRHEQQETRQEEQGQKGHEGKG